MDVRIGSIDTTIVDSTPAGAGPVDDANLDRIARRVMAMIERRQRFNERSRSDRDISSPDAGDVEDYG